MDKGVVIQPQQAVDLVLRLPCPRFADEQRLPIRLDDKQVERAGAAALAARPPPHHAVDGVLLLEIQDDVHVILPLMDQFFIAFGARLPPQRPGDCIQQRRFTRAIGSGQAGKVDAVKAQVVWRAIGQEISNGKT